MSVDSDVHAVAILPQTSVSRLPRIRNNPARDSLRSEAFVNRLGGRFCLNQTIIKVDKLDKPRVLNTNATVSHETPRSLDHMRYVINYRLLKCCSARVPPYTTSYMFLHIPPRN